MSPRSGPNRRTPVCDGLVLRDQAAGAAGALPIGGQAWFEWLRAPGHERFAFSSADGGYTARRERRRGGEYWYAYRRREGRLHNAYLGRPETLTAERLRAVAAQLNGPAPPLGRSRRQPPAIVQPGMLATKLFAPPSRLDRVVRERLLERLDAGLAGALTLISAPAGFGKTSLLADWLARVRRPVAWLTLEEADADLGRFLRYVVAALRVVEPSFGDALLALLNTADTSPPALLTEWLNQLAGLPDACLLVLDDYHLVRAPAVHEAVIFLLDHRPPTLHLVIASREDPPLPLARLRARRQLTELRAGDLTFTSDEAADFLCRVMGLALPPSAIKALEARTEGWIAGLQLAALALQGAADPAAVIAAFSGSHRFVLDYLTDEVLERQPAPIQSFLLQTAILDRLCPEVCDAVTGRDDSQPMLDRLERANLFLAPLDAERRWFRYHYLFASALRDRLHQTSPELVNILHRRAASWYEAAGLLGEAIDHALAGGAADVAARLVETAVPALFRRADVLTILEWLGRLPPELVRRRPGLCLARAWSLAPAGRVSEIGDWLAAAEALLGSSLDAAVTPETAAVTNYRAEILALRVIEGFHRGDYPRVIRLRAEALAHAGENAFLRATINAIAAQAALRAGLTEAADISLVEAAADGRTTGNLVATLSTTYRLALLRVAQGRLHAAARLIDEATEWSAGQGGTPVVRATLRVGLAEIFREWNQLERATALLEEGLAACRHWFNPDHLIDALISLAWAHHGLGDAASALTAIAEADDLARRGPVIAGTAEHVAAHQARLWLAQGRVADAIAWAGRTGGDMAAAPDRHPFIQRDGVGPARVRVLLAQGRSEAAIRLAEALRHLAEAAGLTGRAIELLTLAALAQPARRSAEALRLLARALVLAEPEGYARVFLDEGAPLAALLDRLATALHAGRAPSPSPSAAYLARLVGQFGSSSTGPTTPSRLSSLRPDSRPVELLSAREQAVLRRVAAGASNAEIARDLTVEISTVKTHLKNLFGKLEVHNRTAAVARARHLGLVD